LDEQLALPLLPSMLALFHSNASNHFVPQAQGILQTQLSDNLHSFKQLLP